MAYQALATDYDGTIADDGVVARPTLSALKRLKESGRKLILVTGRELNDLLAVFPENVLFDRIVAENGAIIYRPDTQAIRILTAPPPERFVQMLRQRGVHPLSVGQTIVAAVDVFDGQGSKINVRVEYTKTAADTWSAGYRYIDSSGALVPPTTSAATALGGVRSS